MNYALWAIMRDGRELILCESPNLDLFERVIANFTYGDHIARFIIRQGFRIVKVKDLLVREEEEKCLSLKKEI